VVTESLPYFFLLGSPLMKGLSYNGFPINDKGIGLVESNDFGIFF
jgi:hypothetical protein